MGSKKKFDFMDNSFDLLRLYSAFYVMTLHITRHIALREVPRQFDWWNGVVILFCISGFLVPASMERSKGIGDFLKKRVLRIVPSMWICIITGIIVAGLFCGFVFDKTFGIWFAGQLAFIRDFPQPDFITAFGTGNFQGNLWTMIFTVQFYIITAFAYKFLHNKRLGVWSIVLGVTIGINLAMPYIQSVVPENIKIILSHSCLPYLYIYFLGWFFYRYHDIVIPVLSKTVLIWVALFILRALYCDKYEVRIGEYQDLFQVILLCMITIGLSYKLGRIRIAWDISYGLYLYHMIVVDIFVHLGQAGNPWCVIAVYSITVLLALVSLHLIDRPIGKLFNKSAQKKEVLQEKDKETAEEIPETENTEEEQVEEKTETDVKDDIPEIEEQIEEDSAETAEIISENEDITDEVNSKTEEQVLQSVGADAESDF